MDALPTRIDRRHLGKGGEGTVEMREAFDRQPGKIIPAAVGQSAGGIEPWVELQKVQRPTISIDEKLHTADPRILQSLYEGLAVLLQDWGRRHRDPIYLIPRRIGAVGAQDIVLKIRHQLSPHCGKVAVGPVASDVSLDKKKVIVLRPGRERRTGLFRAVANNRLLPEEKS